MRVNPFKNDNDDLLSLVLLTDAVTHTDAYYFNLGPDTDEVPGRMMVIAGRSR